MLFKILRCTDHFINFFYQLASMIDIYFEAPHSHACEDCEKVIEFKSDNESHKQL